MISSYAAGGRLVVDQARRSRKVSGFGSLSGVPPSVELSCHALVVRNIH